MKTLVKSNPDNVWLTEPGQWRPCRLENGKKTANVSCPDCGKVSSLSDHAIGDNGAVAPSLVCPNDECSFHDYIFLEAWKP